MNGKNFVNMICSSTNIEQYKRELEKACNKLSKTLGLKKMDDHLKFMNSRNGSNKQPTKNI